MSFLEIEWILFLFFRDALLAHGSIEWVQKKATKVRHGRVHLCFGALIELGHDLSELGHVGELKVVDLAQTKGWHGMLQYSEREKALTLLGSIGTHTLPVLGCTTKGDLSKWLRPLDTLISKRG